MLNNRERKLDKPKSIERLFVFFQKRIISGVQTIPDTAKLLCADMLGSPLDFYQLLPGNVNAVQLEHAHQFRLFDMLLQPNSTDIDTNVDALLFDLLLFDRLIHKNSSMMDRK